jgi:hypothetical protein
LTLDDLEPEEYDLIKQLGNASCNILWERYYSIITENSDSDETVIKPSQSDSSYSIREKFIRAKYQQKRFLYSPEESAERDYSAETLTAMLHEACEGNVRYFFPIYTHSYTHMYSYVYIYEILMIFHNE